MAMFGIDVSHWQMDNGMNTSTIQADFVICKATQGTSYKDKTMEKAIDGALKSGKLGGLYHFADGKSSGKAEADWFLKNVNKYVGKVLLVLDWEADALRKGAGYAKEFSDRVYEKTGIKPILYCSLSTVSAAWKEYAAKYPYIWIAKYGSNPTINGYSNNIPSEGSSVSPFKKEIIRQYNAKTHLSGYKGDLDANKCYISKDDWKTLCKASGKINESTGTSKPAPSKDTTKKPKLSVDEVAKKIIAGTNGWNVTGEARKKKLKAEGYDPDKVQARVNELLKGSSKPKLSVDEVAKKIIQGKGEWAVSGEARKKKLRAEGYDPDQVQKRINQLLR